MKFSPDRWVELPTMKKALQKRSARKVMTLGRLREKRQAILDLSARHGASNVRVFGSVSRGEAGPKSDVDFLVAMEQGRSLLDLAGLIVDMQEILGRPVDVVTEDCLHWYIRPRVLQEAIPL